MHFSWLKFAAITIGSVIAALIIVFGRSLRTGEDPTDDDSRAFLSILLGAWAVSFCLIWSFTETSQTIIWWLRGIAIFFGLLGFGFNIYFCQKPEIADEDLDAEPTGFKNNSTDLHLE